MRADSTNDDPHPLRNRVRAGLLPQLEQEYGPGVEAALCRAAEHLWDEIEWTEPLVAEAGEAATEGDGLSVTTLQSLPTGLRHRVLRQFVAAAGHPLRDLSQERWEALEALALKGQTGRRLELSPDLGVEVSYGVLRVVGPDEATPADDVEVRLQVPGQAELPGGGCLEAALGPDRPALPAADAPEAVLDAAHAGPVLVVRRARPGDSFIPLGMAGRKKLQDYFVDNKVPPRQRRPWVVTRADGEILWIVGYRLSDSACVRDATSQFLTLRLCGPG